VRGSSGERGKGAVRAGGAHRFLWEPREHRGGVAGGALIAGRVKVQRWQLEVWS
jgi:hypothetical protein